MVDFEDFRPSPSVKLAVKIHQEASARQQVFVKIFVKLS